VSEPKIDSKFFECPHCKAESAQTWFQLYADPIRNEGGSPLQLDEDDLERLRTNPSFSEEKRSQVVNYWERVVAGDVFLDRWVPCYSEMFVANLSVSACHACRNPTIWLRDQIVFPQ
jgi:hypothetical protein